MKPETFNYNDYLRLQSEMDKRNEYANALIAEVEQLQNGNEVLRAERDELYKNNCKLRAGLATVTAERDAAVEDLTLSNTRKFNNPCEFCKKSGKNCAPVDIQDVCKAWQWRGERSE